MFHITTSMDYESNESQPGGQLKVSIWLDGRVERLDRLVTPLESIDSKLAPHVIFFFNIGTAPSENLDRALVFPRETQNWARPWPLFGIA